MHIHPVLCLPSADDIQQGTVAAANSLPVTPLSIRSLGSTFPVSYLSKRHSSVAVRCWCLLLQGVDIFSKDFLLIPIHDALHWSLIIVCHPGLDFDSSDRRPYILHLDSMEGEPLLHVLNNMIGSAAHSTSMDTGLSCMSCKIWLQMAETPPSLCLALFLLQLLSIILR